MEKRKVDAVHDDDLMLFLDNLGLKNKFLQGMLHCAFCDDVITMENLHSLFPDSGAIKCCCVKPRCISDLIGKIGQS